MTLIQHYEDLSRQGSIILDDEQLIVLRVLQSIFDALLTEHSKRAGLTKLFRNNKTVNGLYLWGGVGVGKTMLLDSFYQALPFEKKLRMNFYQFMQHVHDELRNLQGQENPLQQVAKNIAHKAMVLCFDEFIVTDAVDALILKELLCELFSQGVCIIATSNVMPDNICRKAWRENFMPAIAAIKQHMTVFHIASEIDYRKQINTDHNFIKHQQMEVNFAELTQGQRVTDEALELFSYKIPVRKRSDDIAWFNFSALCSIPRSQQDYLAIAEKYKTIFLSDIPIISASADNTINLFIRLIDILYDQNVRLIFSSAAPVEKLYTEGKMAFEFERTCSRLLEMKTNSHSID